MLVERASPVGRNAAAVPPFHANFRRRRHTKGSEGPVRGGCGAEGTEAAGTLHNRVM